MAARGERDGRSYHFDEERDEWIYDDDGTIVPRLLDPPPERKAERLHSASRKFAETALANIGSPELVLRSARDLADDMMREALDRRLKGEYLALYVEVVAVKEAKEA